MIRIQRWSFFCLLALISTPLSTALDLPLQPLYVNVGCYNNPGSLEPQVTYPYESPGYCQQLCWKSGHPIAALTGGNQCYCGTETPDSSYQVDEGSCNLACAGYAMVNCGGRKAWSIYSANIDTDPVSNLPATITAPSIDPAVLTQIPITVDSVGSTTTPIPIGSSTKTASLPSTFITTTASFTAKNGNVYDSPASSSVLTIITTAPSGTGSGLNSDASAAPSPTALPPALSGTENVAHVASARLTSVAVGICLAAMALL